MNKKRLVELDIAKGIGIVLVVLGHILPQENNLKLFIYSFHMPLFFFISGMVLCMPENVTSISRIIISEKRLIVTYLLYSIGYLFIDVFVRFFLLNEISRRNILENIFYTVTTAGINVLWFLGTLIVAKIAVKISLIYCNTYTFKIIYCFIAMICPLVFNHVLDIFSGFIMKTLILVILRVIFCSLFIMVGYITKEYMTVAIKCPKASWGSALLFLNILFCTKIGYIDIHAMLIGSELLALILMFTGTMGVIFLSVSLQKVLYIRKILLFLGNNSLFIMATHNYLYIGEFAEYIVKSFVNSATVIHIMSFCLLMLFESVIAFSFSSKVNDIINHVSKMFCNRIRE